jgi:hypothetical protein
MVAQATEVRVPFKKKNHHYVPQHWQRGFRGSDGKLYGKFGSDIRIVSPRTIMQSDWLYTVFDDQWNPSDAMEDFLSAMEGRDARLFQQLSTLGYLGSSDERGQLCAALALQAARHPDVLGRGVRRSRELGAFLASAHSMTLGEFESGAARFGVSDVDAQDLYAQLCARTKEQLTWELTELQALSPQSAQLPAQDAIRAAPLIRDAIEKLQLWLLDAPSTEAFVLGDTPLPQSELSSGFTVPLSTSLAVLAMPTSAVQSLLDLRRNATAVEIAAINRTQSDNAFEVVIGPSAAILASL